LVDDWEWGDRGAVFDLSDLGTAETFGLLYQWATAPYWTRAMQEAGFKSQRAFAKHSRLSEDRLNNLVSGRRIARFEDAAAMSFLLSNKLKRNPLPGTTQLRRTVRDAMKRCGAVERPGSQRPDRDAEQYSIDVERDFDLAREVLARTLLADPLVLAHLSPKARLVNPLEIEVVPSAGTRPAGGSGLVTTRSVTGRVRLPLAWRHEVYERCRGRMAGHFVVSIDGRDAHGGVRCSLVRTCATEDGPVSGDVTFRAEAALVASSGRITWAGDVGGSGGA
jgi:hypothetical protein